jgi:hypothetical protein
MCAKMRPCMISALLGFAALASQVLGDVPTAVIDSGPIFGTTTSLPGATATTNKFLGVQFAQSPPKRFTPPARLAKTYSSTPYNATAYSASCTQQFNCAMSPALPILRSG